MRRDCAFLAGLSLITLACWWPVVHLGFIGYDDLDYVYQNSVVQSGINPDSVAWAFAGAHAGNWHPITWLSHMFDCEMFGLNPQEEHCVNLILHTVNVLLVFIWLKQLTGVRWRGFLVAALFAAHPLHVQSVAWISERKDVLSGFFFLLTLLSYTHYCRNQSTKNCLVVTTLLALGLMAKPMLVSAPIVLLLIDFWPMARGRSNDPSASKRSMQMTTWKPLLVEKIPMFALCAFSCLVTLWAQSSGGAMGAMEVLSLPNRCLHALISYSLYLDKMAWPANLAIFYPLSLDNPAGLAVLGSLFLLLCLFAAGIWRRNAQPYLLMGWAWFFVMLLPVIGLVQVGLQSMADRYTYLPSIGLFIAVAWGLADIVTRSAHLRVAGVCLGSVALLACGVDTRYQLRFWKNNITLFQHVVDVSPKNNYMGYFYLGISYGELGQYDLAARCLARALEAKPGFSLARSRLGNVLLVEKKFAEAEPYLEAEAKLHPDSMAARVTYGMALAGCKKYATAQSEYLAAQLLDSNNSMVSQLLAANAPKADAELALNNLIDQLKSNPSPDLHARIALAATVLGRHPEAVQHYKEALAQNPDFTDCLNNLAWILATSPDPAVRNGPEAVELAQRACEHTQYRKTIFIGTLAAACAEAGHFDAAVLNAQKACTNASANGETDLLESNQKLLNLYRNQQPYHEATENP